MAKIIKSYWIKERHNPQLTKPYYSLCGQLSKTAARKKENSLYGFNIMLEFPTLAEYEAKVKELKDGGETVYG